MKKLVGEQIRKELVDTASRCTESRFFSVPSAFACPDNCTPQADPQGGGGRAEVHGRAGWLGGRGGQSCCGLPPLLFSVLDLRDAKVYES